MGRETKSNGQKDPLDRFYTPDDIVQKCLSIINLDQYDCIIEPSAGTGSFLKYLPETTYAYDIEPNGKAITKQDWFTLDKTQFKGNKILVIGNPPFGEQNRLAIKFFNEAAKFCDTIAFILPLSFKKDSIQNNLNLSFSLENEIILNEVSFNVKNEYELKVPCVFQVWVKTNKQRKKVSLKTTSDLFDFTTADKADFRIQRVGGNAGKASFDLNRAASSNYFIKNKSDKTNEEFVNFVNQLNFPSIEFTVGPKSLSKGELVAVIEDNFNK